jgi:hypothetical protein
MPWSYCSIASSNATEGRLEMRRPSVHVGDTSAARICRGKVRPTMLVSAPEEEEKGGGQREVAGYFTVRKSAWICCCPAELR